jgi:hypothetical protein
MESNEDIRFCGPLEIYGRRVDRGWEAWVDPFSVAGAGPTFEAAAQDAQKNLELLFEALAESVARHGSKVRLLEPLDESLKKGAKVVVRFLIYGVVRDRRRAPAPARPLKPSRRNILELLRTSRRVGVVPPVAV